MCGIAGIFHLNSNNNVVSRDDIQKMISIMKYRGPDESGIYIDNMAALGHVRLSIIDLHNGSQPISNENKTLWIIYNGEVYNYPELQKKLIAKGHTFKTNTDTEVILHLFEEKGEECVNDLNGQFAFAIWDCKKQILFLARDRVGVRPLHYATYKGTFYFASEIKAIFAASQIPREIDPHAIDQIFTFWTTLPGATVFKNVFELKPGHCMTVSMRNCKINRYWDFPFYAKDDQLSSSPLQISEEIQDLLKESVRIRLRADVPVGAYLSGGLDSSGITTIIKNYFDTNINTFGIRFEEDSYDEGKYQKEMVRFLDVKNHFEIIATNETISDNFIKVLWHAEKPLLRTAPVPLYLLSKLVKEKGITVVLTGEGADEVFGGYDIFREALIRKFWSRKPDSHIRPLLIQYIYKDVFKNNALRNNLITFFGRGIQNFTDPFFSHRIRWDNTKKIKNFFSSELREELNTYNCMDDLQFCLPDTFCKRDTLGKAQYLEIMLFLSNYLLSSQGDRVAMANSIEIRFPYLDHHLIEYMARVPSFWKILGINEKHILKNAYKNILPEVITARTKQPYRAPVSQSLLHLCSEKYTDLLSQSMISSTKLFNYSSVTMLRKKIENSKNPSELDSMALAGILSTQALYNQFIDNFDSVSKGDVHPNCTVFIDKRTI